MGTVTWGKRCLCDLTAQERERIKEELGKGRARLKKLETAAWVGLREEFTIPMADCILRELQHPRVDCLSKWHPMCWKGTGYAVLGGEANVCALTIKAAGFVDPISIISSTVFHEVVHGCGKIGHGGELEIGDKDDPEEWSHWLGGFYDPFAPPGKSPK